MGIAPGLLAAELLAHGPGGISLVTAAPLAMLTTLRVGGSAEHLVTVEDEAALQHVAAVCRRHGAPLTVLGRGSNVLVADEGLPGVVVRLGTGLRGVVIDGPTVVCGGAEPLPSVAVTTARAGLAGFAWGAAVPGTVGGGVRMNAGAHGADMAASVVSARVLDPTSGAVEDWSADRLAFGYRHSALPAGAVVLAATLHLTRADPTEVLAEIDAIRRWRREHQPLERPSCGSVFTNPDGDSAGALIERAGLKGERVGGAEVSHTHANFIVTEPGATAADVAALIARVQARVHEVHGVQLTPEVVRLGDAATDR
jgi:UDP-N-acetylmuramate dehydrogenase